MYEAIIIFMFKKKTWNHAVIKGWDIILFQSLVLFCKTPVHSMSMSSPWWELCKILNKYCYIVLNAMYIEINDFFFLFKSSLLFISGTDRDWKTAGCMLC